jgi:hypothetical protein
MQLRIRRTFGILNRERVCSLASGGPLYPRARAIGIDHGWGSWQVALAGVLCDPNLLIVVAESWGRRETIRTTLDKFDSMGTDPKPTIAIGRDATIPNPLTGRSIVQELERDAWPVWVSRSGPGDRHTWIGQCMSAEAPRVVLRISTGCERLLEAIERHTHKRGRDGRILQGPNSPQHAIDALGHLTHWALAHAAKGDG